MGLLPLHGEQTVTQLPVGQWLFKEKADGTFLDQPLDNIADVQCGCENKVNNQ